MEKRKLTRAEYKIEAQIVYKGENFSGEAKNLSLKGALIEIDENAVIDINEKLDILFLITGQSSNLIIKVEGTVVRKGKGYIGLKFDVIDLDSFIHLRNIVAYNDGDYEKIMNEFINDTHEKQ
jgi:hypothetical protein